MKEIKLSITTEHVFSKEEISDLIVGALEGGINYWCRKAVIKRNAITCDCFGVLPEDQDKFECASDAISYGGTLILFDIESNDKWELTLENVLKGIKMHCENINRSPKDLLDDYDADDCDAIVQLAIFNEVQFC